MLERGEKEEGVYKYTKNEKRTKDTDITHLRGIEHTPSKQ